MSLFDSLPVTSTEVSLIPTPLVGSSSTGKKTSGGGTARHHLSLGALMLLPTTGAHAHLPPPIWCANPLEMKVVLPFANTAASTNKAATATGTTSDDNAIDWKLDSARHTLQQKTRATVTRRLTVESDFPLRIGTGDSDTRRRSPIHSVREGILALPRSGGLHSSSSRGKQKSKAAVSDLDDVDQKKVPLHAHECDVEWPLLEYDDPTSSPVIRPAVARPMPPTLRVEAERQARRKQQDEAERRQLEQQRRVELQQTKLDSARGIVVAAKTGRVSPNASDVLPTGSKLVVRGKQRKSMMKKTAARETAHNEQQDDDADEDDEPAPAPPPSVPPKSRVLHLPVSVSSNDQLQLPREFVPAVPIKNSTFLKKGSSTAAPAAYPSLGIAPTSARSRTLVKDDRPGASLLCVSSATCGQKQAFLYRLGDLGRN